MIVSLQNIPAGIFFSRIVSLVPSQTELLYDLGLHEEVVGITKFCVHPAIWQQQKTKVGGTKKINIAAINIIKPDLIIANKEENEKEQIEELATSFTVFITDVKNFQDAVQMINDIGRLVGKTTEAWKLTENITMKFKKLAADISLNKKLKAAYLIWKDPLMTVGGDTFINNMMCYCGFENIFSAQQRYPEITPEDLKNNCDIILLSSEPFPFKEKHITEISEYIPAATIILVDGEMFSWYGSRLLKAADYFLKLNKANPAKMKM